MGNAGGTITKLSAFFKGYSYSWGGAVIGFIWAFIIGFIVGSIFALFYDMFSKMFTKQKPAS